MIDDIPEEDKLLHQEQENEQQKELRQTQSSGGRCKHEWEFLGNGVRRGDPTMAVIDFYCKYCVQIKRVYKDQREMNLQWDDDSTDFRDK